MGLPVESHSGDAGWFVFQPFENERYDRQRRFSDYTLFAARDALDLYSNHAQVHVEEVMEQCLAMFAACREWLSERIPNNEEKLLQHLMIAAKYHDIGMAPSEEIMEMLRLIDSMYRRALAGGRDLSVLAMNCQRLMLLAERAMVHVRALNVVQALCCGASAGRETWNRLQEALVFCHDAVKQHVRENHARVSGLYVLDHASLIADCYGRELDIPMVAAVAALHSLSSKQCDVIGYEDAQARKESERCVVELLKQRGIAMPDSAQWLHAVVLLASILRLADARRSGARLSSMDGAKLSYEIYDGRVELYKDGGECRERINDRRTCEILLAECCSEFGDVSFVRGEKTFVHPMEVRDWQQESLWRAFCKCRLEEYIQEIQSGEFGRTGNRIELHLVGEPPSADALEKMRMMLPRGSRVEVKLDAGIIKG